MSVFVRQLGWRLVLVPSVVFATTVFVCGLFPVSPFATWPPSLVGLLAAPGLIGALFVIFASRQLPDRPTFRGLVRAFYPGWRGPALLVLVVVVSWSFLAWILGRHFGTPEIIDGRYVLTDRGHVVETIDRQTWLKLRTDQTRIIAGHLMYFGLIGLLAVSSTEGKKKPFFYKKGPYF